MNNIFKSKTYGFTLVELLVVIAIVSILAGALFIVIDPVRIRRKAKEAALKSSVSKVCASIFACASVKSQANQCDGYIDLGISNPPSDPLGAEFSREPFLNGDIVSYVGKYSFGSDTCSYSCSFNFSNGFSENLRGVGCL